MQYMVAISIILVSCIVWLYGNIVTLKREIKEVEEEKLLLELTIATQAKVLHDREDKIKTLSTQSHALIRTIDQIKEEDEEAKRVLSIRIPTNLIRGLRSFDKSSGGSNTNATNRTN